MTKMRDFLDSPRSVFRSKIEYFWIIWKWKMKVWCEWNRYTRFEKKSAYRKCKYAPASLKSSDISDIFTLSQKLQIRYCIHVCYTSSSTDQSGNCKFMGS